MLNAERVNPLLMDDDYVHDDVSANAYEYGPEEILLIAMCMGIATLAVGIAILHHRRRR